MTAFSLDSLNTLCSLAERNAKAEKLIAGTALWHGGLDVIIGLAGTVIPGAGAAGVATSMALQIPIYHGMIERLAVIYSTQPDKLNMYDFTESVAIGGAAMFAAEFGIEFLSEIAKGILLEYGFTLAASVFPVIGSWVGAGLDLAIATTMTWRLGTMTSIYFQNGHNWVESRKATYIIAKRIVSNFLGEDVKIIDSDLLAVEVPSILENRVQTTLGLIESFRDLDPLATNEKILNVLISRGIAVATIMEAFSRLKSMTDLN